MSTSILLEDVCFECNKNNGVQSGTHCKFCNKPLYKNKWVIDMIINTQLILSSTTELNHFKDFLTKNYREKKIRLMELWTMLVINLEVDHMY